MKRNQLIANSAVLAFFLFMFICAFELHEIRRFGEVGSGFWPLLVLSLATLLSLVLLIKEWKSKNQAIEEKPEIKKGEPSEGRKKVVLSILCLLFYVVAIPLVGFILSTLLFIFPFVFILGERRRWVLILSPFLVTALTTIVFAKFIAMPFPKGIGFFAAFSRLFY